MESQRVSLNMRADPVASARWDAAELPLQKIRHALAIQANGRAEDLLAEAIQQLEFAPDRTRWMDRPLSDLKQLTQRIVNVLEKHLDATTVGDMLQVHEVTIPEMKNCGEATLREVRRCLFTAAVEEIGRLEEIVIRMEGDK